MSVFETETEYVDTDKKIGFSSDQITVINTCCWCKPSFPWMFIVKFQRSVHLIFFLSDKKVLCPTPEEIEYARQNGLILKMKRGFLYTKLWSERIFT